MKEKVLLLEVLVAFLLSSLITFKAVSSNLNVVRIIFNNGIIVLISFIFLTIGWFFFNLYFPSWITGKKEDKKSFRIYVKGGRVFGKKTERIIVLVYTVISAIIIVSVLILNGII
jgi:hypothetical protein